MTVLHAASPTEHRDVRSRSVLVIRPGHGLVAVPYRRHDAGLARLFARWLDSRLAAGELPEAGRLLAVRAGQLVGADVRNRLARRWDDVAARTRSQRVDATAEEIQRVADLLRADRPMSARGVALATVLLDRPTNPGYRLGRGGADIAAAVARALASPVG